jgi:hypothetical protein
MVEEFEDAIRDLKPGSRTGIFRTPFGFHIAELRGKVPAGQVGFEEQFLRWCPRGKYSGLPPGMNPLEENAWKMLPLYNAKFLFAPPDTQPGKRLKGEWLLEIRVVPDTGFTQQGRGEADPSDFANTQCESRLELYAFIVLTDMNERWLRLSRRSVLPERDDIAMDGANGIRVIGLRKNLTHLADRAAVEKLAGRFRGIVKREGGNVGDA